MSDIRGANNDKVSRVSLPESSQSSSPPPEENIYRIKRGGHRLKMTEGLAQMLDDDFMTDVTLACEGKFMRAHKVVLASASRFFKEYFETYKMDKAKEDGMIVFTNMKFDHLQTIIRFIYHGNGSIKKAELYDFIDTARTLKVDGYVMGLESMNADTVTAPTFSAAGRRNTDATTSSPIVHRRPSVASETSTTRTGATSTATKRPRTSSSPPQQSSSATTTTSTELPSGSNRASTSTELSSGSNLASTSTELPSGSNCTSISRPIIATDRMVMSENPNFSGNSEPRIKVEFQGSGHNISVNIKEEPTDDDDVQIIYPPRNAIRDDLRLRLNLLERNAQIRESRLSRFMLQLLDPLTLDPSTTRPA